MISIAILYITAGLLLICLYGAELVKRPMVKATFIVSSNFLVYAVLAACYNVSLLLAMPWLAAVWVGVACFFTIKWGIDYIFMLAPYIAKGQIS